jgi:hypothetical protein
VSIENLTAGTRVSMVILSQLNKGRCTLDLNRLVELAGHQREKYKGLRKKKRKL